MKRKTKLAGVLVAALAALGIGWSLAEEQGQAKEQAKEQAKPHKPARRSPLAWLFGKDFERGMLVGGYRSVTLTVREPQLLALRPGDYVDVLATFDAAMSDKRLEKVTATLLQHVKVLGVVKSGDLNGVGAVHLLVNPNEAQYAALARHLGEIDVVLRAEGDEDMMPMEIASFRKLFK